MSEKNGSERKTAFRDLGFSHTVDLVKEEIRELYQSDRIPWVVGYSGGKDSTATLQLIWLAISELPVEERSKVIHVISTDTLVENPIVATWVNRSLEKIKEAANAQKLPVQAHRLTPKLDYTFWVNLIGRGYPAPRNKFRWCTERLKISPSNTFIQEVVRDNGEAILVLGTRKAESPVRASNMALHEKKAVRDRLTPNSRLPNSLVYTPVADWTNDDVWQFLMQVKNPWGYKNKDLLSMYRGASADGECPLVVDTSTPSCGSSRFGCWVCTLVDEDRSMAAMVQNDEEKEWMQPLLELRRELDFRGGEARKLDRSRRDFRRMTGRLHHYTDKAGETKLVPGPYKQDARAYWLRRVLETQQWIRNNGPEDVRGLELITPNELQKIRRIWVIDKHEIEDLLPAIYEEATGETYDCPPIDDNVTFDLEALEILKGVCDGDGLHFELVRNLLNTERRFRTMATRRNLFLELEKTVAKCFYNDEADALERAMQHQGLRVKKFVPETVEASIVKRSHIEEEGKRPVEPSLPLFQEAAQA